MTRTLRKRMGVRFMLEDAKPDGPELRFIFPPPPREPQPCLLDDGGSPLELSGTPAARESYQAAFDLFNALTLPLLEDDDPRVRIARVSVNVGEAEVEREQYASLDCRLIKQEGVAGLFQSFVPRGLHVVA